MAVQVKASVSYAEKMGQPNYGSIGAQCVVEIEITEDDLAAGRLQEEIRLGFDACRQAVKAELALQAVAPPAPKQQQQQQEEAVASVYAAAKNPKDMSAMLRQWSKDKPIGAFREKWEPLLVEAKAYVNAKVTAGAWTDYDDVVGTIRDLSAQLDTTQQANIAF
jgi:hypothetical protein